MKFTYVKWDMHKGEQPAVEIEIPNGYYKKPNRLFGTMNHYKVSDTEILCVSTMPSIDLWTREQMMQYGWDTDNTEKSTASEFNAVHTQVQAAIEQLRQIVNNRKVN